jgi:hypothetical protein
VLDAGSPITVGRYTALRLNPHKDVPVQSQCGTTHMPGFNRNTL